MKTLLPALIMLIIGLTACKNSRDIEKVGYNDSVNDATIYKKTQLARMSGDDIANLEETAYMMHRMEDRKAAMHVLTTAQGEIPVLWTLPQVRDYFENYNIGNYTEIYFLIKGYKVKKGTREHEGGGEAGISVFKNSYDYIKAKYGLIIENWDVVRKNVPGVHLSQEDAEKVVNFAFSTSEEFYNKYPESLSGVPVE